MSDKKKIVIVNPTNSEENTNEIKDVKNVKDKPIQKNKKPIYLDEEDTDINIEDTNKDIDADIDIDFGFVLIIDVVIRFHVFP